MEDNTTNKWIICRICLKSADGEMLKIFEHNGGMEHISEKIELCGGIVLDNDANMPDSMCYKCSLLLKAAFKFRSLCQSSQEQLRQLLQLQAPKEGSGHIGRSRSATITYSENVDTSLYVLKKENVHSEYNATEDYGLCIEGEESQDEFIELPNEVEFLEEEDSVQNAESDDRKYNPNAEYEVLKENDSSTNSVDALAQTNIRIVRQNIKEADTSSEAALTYSPAKRGRRRKTKSSTRAERITAAAKNITSNDDGEGANHICCYCGNIYNEKAKLTLHMKIHTKEKPHECEICHKRFAQTPQLARHMNSHTGSRPYKCKFCDASFGDPSTCIKHQRIHTNERPYKCETCGKSFAYSNVLKVHVMTHTGEKPHSCSHCGKKFAQLHHKRSHERIHKEDILLKLEDESVDNFN